MDELTDEIILFGRDIEIAMNAEPVGPDEANAYEDMAAWLIQEGYGKVRDAKPRTAELIGKVCRRPDFGGYA